MTRASVFALVLLTGCGRDQVALKYQMGIDPAAVTLVETAVAVDPADMRVFFADQPFRTVAVGVGYEVVTAGGGVRIMKITQEAALGFKFTPEFQFTLLPPADGLAPPLLVSAQAFGPSHELLGAAAPLPAAFGKGVELVVKIVDQRCGGEVCAEDEQCCAGACVHTGANPANCGACGKACASSETCSGGVCRCAGGSACGAGLSCCEVGCVDTQSDEFNCGACGKTCRPGEQCSAGVCECEGGAACGAAQVCCAGTGCSSTGCSCSGTTCTTMQLCCGLQCVDYLTSNQHCGGCNMACGPPPLSCAGGLCKCGGSVCAPGDACCGGGATALGCANLSNDPKNCSTCGKKCQLNEVCAGGQCRCGNATGCQANEICCGSSCKQGQSDPQNCGSCGNTCGSNETCTSGQCKCFGNPHCVGNQKCCADTVSCIDVSGDPQHCGACTNACANGESCVMGTCMTIPCPPMCTLRGNQCAGGVCSCNGGPECMGATFCCPSGCTNRLTDANNCGQCGKKCTFNELCCNGTCTPRDDRNCRFCGDMCPTACCVCGPATTCPGPAGACSVCLGGGPA